MSGPSRILVVDDALFEQHAALANHPERPARLLAAREGLLRAGVASERLPPRDASPILLSRVHTEPHLALLASWRGRRGMIDPDTYVSPHSIDAAIRAAGGAEALTEALIRGEASRGVALVRPPGHHAEPDRAMGFCLINNVAVAAEAARAAGVARVAIVDIDVHHGNGTQKAFYRDPNVLYVSLHQWPFYPGTGNANERGEGPGLGATVNVPLSEGADDAVYVEAFGRVVLPALRAFRPGIILVSAGFDAFVADPLASMTVSAEGYAWMVSAMELVAEELSIPMGLVLEGGYDLEGLAACVASSTRALVGERPKPSSGPISGRHRIDIERAEPGP